MLRIDQIVEALHAELKPFVKAQRGSIAVATDGMNALELLLWSDCGIKVILCWAGDSARDQSQTDCVVRNDLEIFVGYALGLPADAGLDLFTNRVDRPSLLKLVNDVRAFVLSCVFPEESTMERLEYGDCKVVTLPNGTPLSAYRFTVHLEAGVDVADEREVTVT